DGGAGGRQRPRRDRPARGDGLRGDALAPAEPLLRRRIRGRGAGGRDARRGRRSAARRPRRGGRGVTPTIRKAEPADAAALVELGTSVGREPEGWLITADGWRSVSEERRYLRALRR